MDRPWEDAETISELESDLESALAGLVELMKRGALPDELRPLLCLAPPDGASVHISLRQRETGRQLRRQAPLAEWQPKTSAVWIVYEVPQGVGHGRIESSGDPLTDFILALDHAEREPHLSFVSLKWFRDTYLQKRGYAWADDPDIPRRLIQDATERQILLTHKVPNPKQPEFPVTSIRLNRQNTDVLRVLAEAGHGEEHLELPQPRQQGS